MATHQEISGVSDEDMVNRMLASHDGRFGDAFWAFFTQHVAPHLDANPAVVDLGCGPGLLLRDIGKRYPESTLSGFDITPAMIAYATEQLQYEGPTPDFQLLNLETESLPVADESIDLITMVAVLHVLPEPLPVLKKIRDGLKADGVFLLQDWIRTSLPLYLDRMMGDVPADKLESVRGSMYRLFPAHNKYTEEDWLWLLDQAGFKVEVHEQLTGPHFCTLVCRKV